MARIKLGAAQEGCPLREGAPDAGAGERRFWGML